MRYEINYKFILQILIETMVWTFELGFKIFRCLVPALMFAIFLKVFEIEITGFLSFIFIMLIFGGIFHYMGILNLVRQTFEHDTK